MVPLLARLHSPNSAAGGAAGEKSACSPAGSPTACSLVCSPVCSPVEDLFEKVRLLSFPETNEGLHSAAGGGGAGGGVAGGVQGGSPMSERSPHPRAKSPAAPAIASPTSHIDLPPVPRGAPTSSRDLSDVSQIFFSKNILYS